MLLDLLGDLFLFVPLHRLKGAALLDFFESRRGILVTGGSNAGDQLLLLAFTHFLEERAGLDELKDSCVGFALHSKEFNDRVGNFLEAWMT